MKKSLHLTSIIILAILCIYACADMVERGGMGQLWGYRPLLAFLSGWGALVLAVKWFRPARWRWLGWSTLSGVLLGVGFPDLLPLPWLMLIGFVPLLLVEAAISELKRKSSRWAVFKYTYHAFVVWNVIATYWVANTAFAAGVFAIWVNALLMTIPVLLFHTTRWIMPGLKYPALICFWLSFEYIHLNWELTWPWLTLGNSFAEYPSLVQWYSVTGAFGGSLWIWVANLLALKTWKAYTGEAAYRKPLLQLLGLAALPMAISLLLYVTYTPQGEAREVAVVQPNFEPHYIKFNLPEREQVARFIELSSEVVRPETDYLVYPETSFGLINDRNINQYPAIRRLRVAFGDYPGLKLVTGVDAYHVFEEGETHSPNVRMQVRKSSQDTMFYEVLNAALQLQMGNEAVELYRKSKLVPGPEIFPFKDVFFFMEPLVDRLEGTTAGIGTQPERSVLSSDAGQVAPAICYESIFGEYVTGYIRKGAEAIFIMTNDGWWDNTAGHRQHLYFASLRAIETRRSIARSANSGISAFINQRGDIQQPTRYDEAAAIRQDILFSGHVTFYVRWGDLIARVALFGAALILLNALVRGLLPRQGGR